MTTIGQDQSYLGTIGKFVCCEIDLSKRAFPYQATEGIIADRLQVMTGELAAETRELVIKSRVTPRVEQRRPQAKGGGAKEGSTVNRTERRTK